MTASIQRRLEALERPLGHRCLSCEWVRLTGATIERCMHDLRRTLRDELVELNRTSSEVSDADQ
jgi:hypothetical protein